MNRNTLESNEDLFEYLIKLKEKLKEIGQTCHADNVSRSSQFASGSASEFLHEAHSALQQVVNKRPAKLSDSDMEDIESVLAQINEAFRKIRGA